MRKHIAILGLVVLLLLSGCLGFTSQDAPEPYVDNDTLDNTSYELTDEKTVNNSTSVVITDFEITSQIATYDRNNGVGDIIGVPTSRYVAISTPSVSPLGYQVNPVVLDPTDSTLERLQESTNNSVKLSEQIGTINTTHTSGSNITIKKYNGTIVIESLGAEFDAIILRSVIETDDAVIVAIGGYPSVAEGNQEEALVEMMENTQTE